MAALTLHGMAASQRLREPIHDTAAEGAGTRWVFGSLWCITAAPMGVQYCTVRFRDNPCLLSTKPVLNGFKAEGGVSYCVVHFRGDIYIYLENI